MDTTQSVSEELHNTTLILANAGEIMHAVIRIIAGNEISTGINGSPASAALQKNIFYRELSTVLTAQSKTLGVSR